MAEMHLLVRGWIADILKRNESVVAVALRQRAKFEGWLKFELAAHACDAGATAVQVETSSPMTSLPAAAASLEAGRRLAQRGGRSGARAL